MSQPPAKRHVIAEVRLKAGLSQSQLAKRLGCAAVTVQRIEQGKLALSEELATKAQKVLDVSAGWLLANDPAQPAVTPRGGEWTKDFYEVASGTPAGHPWRVAQNVPVVDAQNWTTTFTSLMAAQIAADIHAMLQGVKGRPKQGILLHRIKKAIEEWKVDFPLDPKTLEHYRPEIEKAQAAFEEFSKKVFNQESDQLWNDSPALPPDSTNSEEPAAPTTTAAPKAQQRS